MLLQEMANAVAKADTSLHGGPTIPERTVSEDKMVFDQSTHKAMASRERESAGMIMATRASSFKCKNALADFFSAKQPPHQNLKKYSPRTIESDESQPQNFGVRPAKKKEDEKS